MNPKKASQTGIQIVLGLILVFFIISSAVVFTLNFRPLYYFDIDHLNIPRPPDMQKARSAPITMSLLTITPFSDRIPWNFQPWPCPKADASILRKLKSSLLPSRSPF